jgi:hypothetical protein
VEFSVKAVCIYVVYWVGVRLSTLAA